jgi:hypothetical protein
VSEPLSVCATCRWAEWEKTANGRRHPKGSGKCAYQFPDGPVPKWMALQDYGRVRVTSIREVLSRGSHGRWIYWKDSHRTEPEPCATWEAK